MKISHKEHKEMNLCDLCVLCGYFIVFSFFCGF